VIRRPKDEKVQVDAVVCSVQQCAPVFEVATCFDVESCRSVCFGSHFGRSDPVEEMFPLGQDRRGMLEAAEQRFEVFVLDPFVVGGGGEDCGDVACPGGVFVVREAHEESTCVESPAQDDLYFRWGSFR
jgi:hypothetical protein